MVDAEKAHVENNIISVNEEHGNAEQAQVEDNIDSVNEEHGNAEKAVFEEAIEESVEDPVKEIVKDQVVNETSENVVPTTIVQTSIPEFVTIFATAILEDSPYENLDQEEIESVYRFVTSNDHLVKNISNVEINYLSSRHLRNSKYKYTIEVKIKVKTANLWEGPRSYIWRHLGNENTWARGNGTKINLVSIHQK